MTSFLLLFIAGSALATGNRTQLATNDAVNRSTPIPINQLGTVAGKQYQGDGMFVSATPEGARLRCVFQRFEGEATAEGLWLTSTVPDQPKDRFRVVAGDLRRLASARNAEPSTLNPQLSTLPATGR